MRIRALKYLCCPVCKGDLSLGQEQFSGDHVMTGALSCASCAVQYPIVGGIPRLIARAAALATETAGRFGRQWKTFDRIEDYHERNLLEWLEPLTAADFKGRVVLEAGCGKGRHTVSIAKWGASDVVAVDLGESVDVAFEHTKHLPNAHIVQADILNLPLRAVFDVAFSVGVIHHLPDPRAGFSALAQMVVPGGTVAVWVYSYESNEWIVRYVNPLREKVTSKIPIPLLYWLSMPVAGGLAATASAYKMPSLGERLPYKGYMKWLSKLPMKEVHNIVFDQLVTPVAYYLPRAEVASWFATGSLEGVVITPFRGNSWRAMARVRDTAAAAQGAPSNN